MTGTSVNVNEMLLDLESGHGSIYAPQDKHHEVYCDKENYHFNHIIILNRKPTI